VYCTDLATELLEEGIITQANATERSFFINGCSDFFFFSVFHVA
jgi:hypothetical protein